MSTSNNQVSNLHKIKDVTEFANKLVKEATVDVTYQAVVGASYENTIDALGSVWTNAGTFMGTLLSARYPQISSALLPAGVVAGAQGMAQVMGDGAYTALSAEPQVSKYGEVTSGTSGGPLNDSTLLYTFARPRLRLEGGFNYDYRNTTAKHWYKWEYGPYHHMSRLQYSVHAQSYSNGVSAAALSRAPSGVAPIVPLLSQEFLDNFFDLEVLKLYRDPLNKILSISFAIAAGKFNDAELAALDEQMARSSMFMQGYKFASRILVVSCTAPGANIRSYNFSQAPYPKLLANPDRQVQVISSDPNGTGSKFSFNVPKFAYIEDGELQFQQAPNETVKVLLGPNPVAMTGPVSLKVKYVTHCGDEVNWDSGGRAVDLNSMKVFLQQGLYSSNPQKPVTLTEYKASSGSVGEQQVNEFLRAAGSSQQLKLASSPKWAGSLSVWSVSADGSNVTRVGDARVDAHSQQGLVSLTLKDSPEYAGAVDFSVQPLVPAPFGGPGSGDLLLGTEFNASSESTYYEPRLAAVLHQEIDDPTPPLGVAWTALSRQVLTAMGRTSANFTADARKVALVHPNCFEEKQVLRSFAGLGWYATMSTGVLAVSTPWSIDLVKQFASYDFINQAVQLASTKRFSDAPEEWLQMALNLVPLVELGMVGCYLNSDGELPWFNAWSPSITGSLSADCYTFYSRYPDLPFVLKGAGWYDRSTQSDVSAILSATSSVPAGQSGKTLLVQTLALVAALGGAARSPSTPLNPAIITGNWWECAMTPTQACKMFAKMIVTPRASDETQQMEAILAQTMSQVYSLQAQTSDSRQLSKEILGLVDELGIRLSKVEQTNAAQTAALVVNSVLTAVNEAGKTSFNDLRHNSSVEPIAGQLLPSDIARVSAEVPHPEPLPDLGDGFQLPTDIDQQLTERMLEQSVGRGRELPIPRGDVEPVTREQSPSLPIP